ncbi:MAG: protein kinase [Deltaproteobacteria bacterium]|nr:protein kinase [Deltaproteobacteria bacterium]
MASTGDFIGRRVGRFTITSHLASGGMAELFIARQEAVGGFEKDLVLKMLQERYAQNPRVVEMFLDEARLAAKLNHQNIVHVYDVDEADGVRYIAMEYIHGETVTDIVRRSIARGVFLPLEHAIHLVGETAAGLAYAHETLDAEGKPARIVHRDISPSNILVTYEGLTKIVDFGIARVQDQIREESGMRPGKVSYMSPEQVRGEPTDHRSDIFSLGTILYEITVGRRLWRGPAEIVMRRIAEELIPPPTYVRRDYPPTLELIVMKALERRPTDRYQSAAELQHELTEFMDDAGLKSGARRLSQYMKDLFAAETNQPNQTTHQAQPQGGTGTGTGKGVESPTTQPEDTEELDFDRRAPLMMRMEARPEKVEGRASAGPSRLAPIPGASQEKGVPQSIEPQSSAPHKARVGNLATTPIPATPGSLAHPVHSAQSANPASPASLANPVKLSWPPKAVPTPLPAATSGPHWTQVPPAIGTVSDARGGMHSSSGVIPIPRPPGTQPGSAPLQAESTESISAVLRWSIVLLLAGALVVVFLATR